MASVKCMSVKSQ